ncbi:MAG TPA: rhodanese-like domain-containing protein [Elusimicrobiota bacterium]|nr:rhodanese-like domain-containing protein [Elusimicrobiota bacterium]
MRKASAVRIVCGGLLLALSAAPLRAAQVGVSTVSCQAVRLMILNRAPHLLIIDVRPPESFAQSHIETAVNAPYSEIASTPIARGQDIVVYCAESTCPLSLNAAKTLISRRYQDVHLLDGGFIELRRRPEPAPVARFA